MEGEISKEFFTIKHESGFKDALHDGDYMLIARRSADVTSATSSRASDWDFKLYDMKEERDYIR